MLAEHPQLLIVGGPNGAGKSTQSKNLSQPGAIIFDADKVLAGISTRLRDVPIESIYFAVRQEFLDQVDDAIKHRHHFTIETNFRDHELMDTVDRFKQHGYITSMIFLTLDTLELSNDRVNERIGDGGHYVDPESIRYNYEEGLLNLEYFADRFDHLDIIDASGQGVMPKLLLSVSHQKVIKRSNKIPAKVAKTVNAIADRFTQKPELRRYRGPKR